MSDYACRTKAITDIDLHCNEPEIFTMQRDSGFDDHFLRSILSLKVFSDQDDPLECSFLLFS